MSERHLKLLTKLIPFLTFLLLWQIGCEFKFQCIAQTSGSCGASSKGYQPSFCSRNGVYSSTSLLPYDEGNAFRDFISKLGLTPAPPISLSFCSDNSLVGMTVSCNCTYEGGSVCHITEIIVQSLNLKGSIHPDISKLTYLERLDLSNNALGGGIPDSLGNLFSLNFLDLQHNLLRGNIPATLGNLKNLTYLLLEFNHLEGNIPCALGSLSSLVSLSLRSNLLTNKIPSELGNLVQLEFLLLSENQLSGTLPEELGRLSSLKYLLLTSNKLIGRVPESYSQLRGLKSFAIDGNNLSGPIPKFIKNWTDLTYLSLLGNNFEGPLPTEIFEMSNLQVLWVSELNSSGSPFPKSANLTNIFTLILRNCSITGPIPTYIGSWSLLTYIDLSLNYLTGEIPDSMGNLNLSNMYLSRNMLSGTVPAWIPKDLQIVDLSYNNFTGFSQPPEEKIQKGFSQPKKQNLYACCSKDAPNMISPFSTKKKRCGKSKNRSLFINCGSQGTTIGKNKYEADNSTLDFFESPKRNWAYSCSGEFMSGTASSSDYIKNLTCGVSVPEAPLYAESRLCPLSLTYYGFCLQKGNYSVKLHFAETVYTDDADYSSLGKRVFDVYIQGKKVLKDFNIKEKAGGPNKAWNETFNVFVNNNDPLVIHFFWAGKGSLFNPPALNGPLVSAISVTPVGKGKLSSSRIALITAASVITPLALLASSWKMGWLGNGELEATAMDIQLEGRSVTLKNLRDATQNFSSTKEIGRSRFARVYEANFTQPYRKVAVKKISSQSKPAMDKIMTLLARLKLLSHDNVVQLIDGYSQNDLHLIVYEYMDNKSLDRVLFDKDPFLDWRSRFNICRGIAKGLKYLHEQKIVEINVHRNIKASNILLDGALNAKVSDFGLATLYDEEDQLNAISESETQQATDASETVNQYCDPSSCGSIPDISFPFQLGGDPPNCGDRSVYMAPEYATRKIISDKVDVYSFGVVLLEIVSGKNSAKEEENHESNFLIDTACNLGRNGRLMELVDENLLRYDNEQVNTVLNLAMMCIDASPVLRPTMPEVVSVLEGEKTILQISKTVTHANQSCCPACRKNYITTA